MQEPNHIQSDTKNPYIQILFNINSKNVVNNNILSQREKQIQFQLPHQLKPQKIDKTFIFPPKKPNQQTKSKTKSKTINKSQISSNKLDNINSQQTCRNKKKSSFLKNQKNYSNDTQKSIKQFKPKKKLSNGLLTPNFQQNELFSSNKKQNKLSKQKIKTNKDLRQKVIQLMIKDYQKGIISAKNFKQAISSLIQQQCINKKYNYKSQIKTEKSKTNFTNTYRNSLGTSLRNTPRHKPSKSKSQKFYHAFEKDSKIHQHHNNIQKQFNDEQCQQPRIVETIIDRKQFVNKIIIKGINTSLFLSNQLTDKDSPNKRDTVQVAVINTSDSVRELRSQMQKTIKQSVVTHNYPQDSFKKPRKQESRNNHIQKNTNFSSQKQQAVLKIQAAWKKYKTKKILSHIMQQIENQQQNNLYYSRLNFSDNKQQQSLQSFQPDSSKNIPQKSQIYVETSNQLIKIQNEFDQFQIREDFEESQNYSKIQQLQKQYALILKDNNDSKYLSSRQYSNSYFKQQRSSNIENQKQIPKQPNSIKNYENNCLNQIEQFKFKPYLSSEIQINSNLKKSFGLESIKNQEINQKKVNMIRSNQIKKLNQILDIVKNQLKRNETKEAGNQKQDKKRVTPSNPLILQKIASILESQRYSLQNQLKIYDKQYKRPLLNDKAQPQKLQKIKPKQQSQNIEVINSFKKKMDNKKKHLLKYQQPQQSAGQSITQKPSFINPFNTQQQHKSFNSSSSVKSLHSSSTYSYHLQKPKISQLNLDYIQIGLKKRLYDITLKKQSNICIITQKFINDKISAKQYQQQKQIIQKWFKLEQNQLKKTKAILCSQYKKAKEFLYKDDIIYTNKLTKQKSFKMIKCISEKYLGKMGSKLDGKNRQIYNDNHVDEHEKEKLKISQQEIKRNAKKARQTKQSHNKSKNIKLQQQLQFQMLQHQRIKAIQKQLLQIQIRNKLPSIQQKSQLDQLSSPQFSLAKSKVQNQIQYLRSSSQILNNDGSKKIEQLNISRKQQQQLQSSLTIVSGNYEQNQSASLLPYKNSTINHNNIKNQSPNKPYELIKLKTQISHFLDKYEQQCLNQNDPQQQSQQQQQQQQIHQQQYLQQQLYHQQQQYQGYNQQQQQQRQQQSDNQQQQSQDGNQLLETYQKNIINYLSDDEGVEQMQEQEGEGEGEGDGDGDGGYYDESLKLQSGNQLEIKQNNQHDFNIIVNRKTKNPKNNYSNEDFQSKYDDKQTLLFSPPRNKFKQQFSEQLLAYEETHQNQNQQLNYPENSQNETRLISENGQNQQSIQFKQNKQSKSQNSQQIIQISTKKQIPASKSVQLSQRKLKYLNQQDKDDIFQFMFLDLCLQLFLQQTKNNKIMKCIQRYILNLRKKRKIPKGFKTNLVTSKSYIQNLTQFIKSSHFQQLKRLQFPMGPSAKQMLKFMRDYNDDSDEDQQIETVNLILNINIYQSYDLLPINKLTLERYYDDDQKQESRVKFLNTLKHIHNKAIFDSLNESLDIQRSYGIWGKPFPWKKSLSLDRSFNQEQLKTKLAKASQKVIQNCSYLCGVMVDKQDSVFGKTNISQQYLNHIREDRMSKMLSNDMVDNQDRWIFYDDQETEVLMEISKYVSRTLFQEFTKQVQSFNFRLQTPK